jgi:hypothetical protein
MVKNNLYGVFFLLLVFILSGCEPDWNKKATSVIKRDCACFGSGNISLSNKLRALLEYGVVKDDSIEYLAGYDSLTMNEKEELRKFSFAVYDTTSSIGSCLNKIYKEEQGRPGNYYRDRLDHKINEFVVANKIDCKFALYYERDAILAAYNSLRRDPVFLKK